MTIILFKVNLITLYISKLTKMCVDFCNISLEPTFLNAHIFFRYCCHSLKQNCSEAMLHLSQKFEISFLLQDKPSYADDFGDSDQEDEPDAYLARVKAEAEERDEDEGGESEDESTDEDFNPDQQESDVAEE
jgi:hypothetical protein